MALPSILVVGATGNTGVGVVRTLSSSINDSTLAGHRILATTRSAAGTSAQRLAQLLGVEVVEMDWTNITAEWLRSHNVGRAFIASHITPTQFAEESAFHLAALTAGLDCVVRISTTACNVRPDDVLSFTRAHWAIEAMLKSPAYAALNWSSLQPNIFYRDLLDDAVDLVNRVRAGGEKGTMRTILAEDVPAALVDPVDVGNFAARLLLERDPARHNGARYVVNGPHDVTGADIVRLVEKHIGGPIRNPSFKDPMSLRAVAQSAGQIPGLLDDMIRALENVWRGEASASTTSKEVLELCAPKVTLEQAFEAALEEA